MRTKITDDMLARLTPMGKAFELRDTEVSNLVLRVNADCTVRTWNVQYRNAAGQRRFYRIGNTNSGKVLTVREARNRAKAILGRIAQGEDVFLSDRQEKAQHAAQLAEAKARDARTLRAFLDDRYAPDYLSTRPSGAATKARIKASWAELLDTDIAKLTKAQIDAIRAKRRAAGLMPQTINRDVTALKALLSKALEWGVIERHPLANMSQMQEEDDKRVRYLADDERERLYAVLPKAPEHLRALTLVALNTGLRRGELFNLQWGDARDGGLYVRAAGTKTRKAGFVPLNKAAQEALKEWRGGDNVVALSGYVFPSPKDATQRANTLKRSWRTLMKAAKIDDFTFHDCRHDFASRLVQSGMNIYAVSKLLRHSSVKLTERYAHLSQDDLRKAVESIG